MWRTGELAPRMTEEEFRLLRDLVHQHCGIFFREDTRFLLERRLRPRLEALGLATFSAYHHHLRFDPGRVVELQKAIELVTTNETYFYREPHQLDALAQEILPELARVRETDRTLRILSAGCSTGEEAYTIAVLVKESRRFDGWNVEIVGCDISNRCIEHARAGVYGEHAFRNVEAESLRRWFHLREGKWSIDVAIKRMVRFSRENLLDPHALATMARLDVLICRNVLIYFDLPARKQVLAQFHEKLRDGGWLLLGHSESLVNLTADFEIVHLKNDLVYRKPRRDAPGEGLA
ncbi:MAG TPA: protein-glutamate O-methyltransferase CheR [Anaeromyxobacter sp.]